MIRLLDVFFSVIGILLLSPLLLIIGILIKLTSKGPFLYKQERVGYFNSNFEVLKFRTMKVNSDKLGLLTVGGRDPRITKIGFYLRKYKLDELPQLFNVLSGKMCLVGPRPEVRKYVNLYTLEQQKILTIKPGITDWASIIYREENSILEKSNDPEADYINVIIPDKIKYNLIFIEKYNSIEYLKIIFVTIWKIINKNKNLTSLWKHLEDGIRKEYSKLLQQITDKNHWDKHTKEDNNFADVVQDMHKKSLHELIQNENSEFAQYLSAIMFYAKSNFKKVGEALDFLKLAEIEIKFDQVNSSYDLDALLKSVRNKYEVLDVFVPHTYGWHYNSKPEMTKILNYINLVDKN